MSNGVFNIGNNQTEKLEGTSLKIGKNVMIYNDNKSFVTLNNITGVSLGKEPKKSYSTLSILFIFAGIYLLFMKGLIVILGLVLAGIGAVSIYMTYESNSNPKEFLIFYLNSGRTFLVNVPKHDFAIQVMDTIINCINSKESVNIDLKDCNISHMQIEENHL